MECPVCYEKFSVENPAMGPGGECQHSACKSCWQDIAAARGNEPVRCPECRRDVTTWVMREFAITNSVAELEDEPAELGNEPGAVPGIWNLPQLADDDLMSDYAEMMRVREALVALLTEVMPHIDRDWESILPYNLEELDMLGVHPSRALNLR